MHGPLTRSKALPRANTSVSLSGDEIGEIEDAARVGGQSRAEFIRDAAVAKAREVNNGARARRPKTEAGR